MIILSYFIVKELFPIFFRQFCHIERNWKKKILICQILDFNNPYFTSEFNQDFYVSKINNSSILQNGDNRAHQ